MTRFRRRSRPSRSAVLLGGLLLAAALTSVPGVAGAAQRAAPVISRGGIGVAVPPRGWGVGAEALTVNGQVLDLQVETAADGTVRIVREPGQDETADSGALAGSSVSPAGSPPACSDPAHKVGNSWWHQAYHWAFRSSSKPSILTEAAAERQLKKAMRNITGAHNDCGLADNVSATAIYEGRTTRGVQISNDTVCTGMDSHNVVAFGDLGGQFLGYTCWWYQGTSTVEADTKLNKHDFSWLVSTAGCIDSYVLQGVATHEFGHTFGLLHVSQASHANLTMSPSIYSCDASDETLGLGDIDGLNVHY